MNRFGHFAHKGHTYNIVSPRTPRQWCNYLWNERYVALVSQVGQGESLLQDSRGRRLALVAARMLFIRDRETGEFWSANALPPAAEGYRCLHSRDGFTIIEMSHNLIASRFRIFVPTDFWGEVWTLRLTNKGDVPRLLQFFPFVDTLIDGPNKPQAYYMSVGRWHEALQTLQVRAECDVDDAQYGRIFLAASVSVSGFDTEQRAFVGYGAWQHPDALKRGRCLNSECEMSKPILALQHDLTLAAGETLTLHWLVGGGTLLGEGEVEIVERRAQFFVGDGIERALQEVRKQVKAELGQITFSTPDPQLDHFASIWLPRQISLGAQWARVRHNGFRDQMQDIAAMAFFNPQRALSHFARVLSYQHPDGHAPRTWLHGQILDKDFSDNHVWIPLTLYNLLMETGDLAILDEIVPFNDGSEADIFEHGRRALEYLWKDRGMFGLCRIHGGDWNDGLDQVGRKGKGVSVWLSMALHLANEQLAILAELRNDTALASLLRNTIVPCSKPSTATAGTVSIFCVPSMMKAAPSARAVAARGAST